MLPDNLSIILVLNVSLPTIFIDVGTSSVESLCLLLTEQIARSVGNERMDQLEELKMLNHQISLRY